MKVSVDQWLGGFGRAGQGGNNRAFTKFARQNLPSQGPKERFR
jgi:hypothetical protein